MFAVIPKTWPLAKEEREPVLALPGMADVLSKITLSDDELSLIESALPGQSKQIYEPFQRYQTFLEDESERFRQSTARREVVVGVLGDPDASEIEVKYCGVVYLRKSDVDRFSDAEDVASGVLKDKSQMWCVK